ncbi:hypothetical protein HYH03_016630 [Edaphochlamys debaryana]|uniref:Protein kinase domain-containing protein n=1 Tax=Edaphochlamys debaryana TaxID=47281 RepID=A0A835XJH5_9CHLO|nr:hypothetical protein HYH03_016630 [Edaphochlamys debaryana]|eukprot:KAG2484589.1 hypothetical protein HYH03_016630 [Edaphochlamys debaryana]
MASMEASELAMAVKSLAICVEVVVGSDEAMEHDVDQDGEAQDIPMLVDDLTDSAELNASWPYPTVWPEPKQQAAKRSRPFDKRLAIDNGPPCCLSGAAPVSGAFPGGQAVDLTAPLELLVVDVENCNRCHIASKLDRLSNTWGPAVRSIAPESLSELRAAGAHVELYGADEAPYGAPNRRGGAGQTGSASASPDQRPLARRRNVVDPCRLLVQRPGCNSEVLMVARKSVTRCVGRTSAAGPLPPADRVAQSLGRELLAHLSKQAALAWRFGGAAAAAVLSAPLLFWEVLASRREPACVELVLYTPWAAQGSLWDVLEAVAKGEGSNHLGTTSSVPAARRWSPEQIAAVLFPPPAPPADWPRVGRLIQALADLLAKLEAAGVIEVDLKLQNVVVDEYDNLRVIDPEGTQVLPLPLAAPANPNTPCEPTTPSVSCLDWRLLPVPVDVRTTAYAPPEMLYEDFVRFQSRGGRIRHQSDLSLTRSAGFLALARSGNLQGVIAAGNARQSYACVASHAWLFGASLEGALGMMRGCLGNRAGQPGYRGAGAVDEWWLRELGALCVRCMAPRPCDRPRMEEICAQVQRIRHCAPVR